MLRPIHLVSIHAQDNVSIFDLWNWITYRGNDALQLAVHGLLAMTRHDKPLFLKLLGNVTGSRARDLDPSL
jgi:hypothetical protein